MTFTSVPGVRVEHVGPVLRVTLERVDVRNAIDDVMMDALVDVFERVGTDDEVRAVRLGGAGDHFCSGADLLARNAGDERPRTGSIQRRLPTQSHRLVALMLTTQVPVVCAVRGWAAGVGFQLALAADFCIAASDARFWAPFLHRGFTPDSGATWLLPRRVGEVRARELLLLGRVLEGGEAAEWGAIHRAVPAKQVDREADAVVVALAKGPTVALGLTKDLLHRSRDSGLEEQLTAEALALELSSRSPDFREGIAAMREKRDPRFGGR